MIHDQDSIFTSTLEVDLKAISHNFDVMTRFAKPNVKKLAVIKANAYGLGAVEIAKYLSQADFFAVANIGEAVELRKAGITKDILVFTPPHESTIHLFENYAITALLSSSDQIKLLINPTVSFHLLFDTGMRRFGVLPAQIQHFKSLLDEVGLQPSGLLTHFSSSGDPNDETVLKQLDLFLELSSLFSDDCIKHCANSGAIAFYPETHLDMIRVGVSMYGFAPGETPVSGLQIAARWKTKIIHTKPVKRGERIGYSWTFEAPSDGFIGLFPVGYADGLKRELGNQIKVRVQQDLLPVIGRITMDYGTVFSSKPIELGAEVEIIGDNGNTVQQMAKATRTIPYEIITSISERRVKRIYKY